MRVRSALCEPWAYSSYDAGPLPAVRFHRVAACRPFRRFTTMLNPMQILTPAPRHDGRVKDALHDPIHVRSSPESGHVRCNSVCPLSANSGHCALFDHLVGAQKKGSWN